MIYSSSEIKNNVKPIADKYNLKAVYLFGSYARGEANENSDIDLVVDTSETDIKGLFALGTLYNDFEKALQKRIDLVTVSTLEEPSLLPSEQQFKINVKQDMVEIFRKSDC